MTNPVAEFLWRIAIKKGVVGLVTTLLASYGAKLAGAGITVDQAALIAFIVAGLTTLRNYVKTKFGWTFL